MSVFPTEVPAPFGDSPATAFEIKRFEPAVRENRIAYETQAPDIAKSEQLNLFDEKILSRKAVDEYQLIGQIFDTYWIAVYHDKMILIDQHAAHEKVKYEMLMKRFYDKQPVSQNHGAAFDRNTHRR